MQCLNFTHNKRHFFNVIILQKVYLKSSDAKAAKCHLKFSSKMTIFIKLVYLSLAISLK